MRGIKCESQNLEFREADPSVHRFSTHDERLSQDFRSQLLPIALSSEPSLVSLDFLDTDPAKSGEQPETINRPVVLAHSYPKQARTNPRPHCDLGRD
jgi:hypothetical protein